MLYFFLLAIPAFSAEGAASVKEADKPPPAVSAAEEDKAPLLPSRKPHPL